MKNENETQLVPSEVPPPGDAVSGEQENFKSVHEFAENEHWAIVDGLKRLGADWVALTLRVKYFKEKKLYREIIDLETGKPFCRFDEWAKSTLCMSVSSVFAQLKTLRALAGIVPEAKLARMTRQNAHALARLKEANKPVDAAVVDDAAELTEAAFKARYENESSTAEKTPETVPLCQLGPFAVSHETVELFKQALETAKRNAVQTGQEAQDDSAIAAIAHAYLAVPHEAPLDLLLPAGGTEGSDAAARTTLM